MARTLPFPLALALLLFAPTAAAGIVTVGPSGAFPDLQPAIDAAQPGDVLLVEPGSYSPFVLSKALRIYAQPGAEIQDHPGLQAEITGIPAGAEAVVHGLTLGTCPYTFLCSNPTGCFSMDVHDNAGTVAIQALDSYGITVTNSALVLVERCELYGYKPGVVGCTSTMLYGPGVALDVDSSAVWVVDSLLEGAGNGTFSSGEHIAGTGLAAVDATIYLAETTVHGGSGGTVLGSCLGGPTFVGTIGRPGVDAKGSSLIKVVSGPHQEIRGGSGGTSTSSCPGTGAPGVDLFDASHLLTVDSIAIAGGADGSFLFPFTHPPIELHGNATSFTTSLRYPVLIGPAQASVGSAVGLTASGNPGSKVWLYLAPGLGPISSFPGVDGATALDLSSLLSLGSSVLDAAGLATFPLAVPPIPALVGFLGAFQAVEVGAPIVGFSNPVTVAVFP